MSATEHTLDPAAMEHGPVEEVSEPEVFQLEPPTHAAPAPSQPAFEPAEPMPEDPTAAEAATQPTNDRAAAAPEAEARGEEAVEGVPSGGKRKREEADPSQPHVDESQAQGDDQEPQPQDEDRDVAEPAAKKPAVEAQEDGQPPEGAAPAEGEDAAPAAAPGDAEQRPDTPHLSTRKVLLDDHEVRAEDVKVEE